MNRKKRDSMALLKGTARSIASSFPGFATFATAWAEYESHQKSERLGEFLAELVRAMEELRSQIEKTQEYSVTSGEFPALLERTMDRVQREASDSKRRVFSRVFAGLLAVGEELGYEEKVDVIEALDALTMRDVEVLRVFASGAPVSAHSIDEDSSLEWGSNEVERMGMIVQSLRKLESRGVIVESASLGNQVPALMGDPVNWISQWRLKFFELLPLGSELIASLHWKHE